MRAARVAYVAVASRLITLLLSALFDRLVADYDTSSRLRTLDCNGRTSASGKCLVIARVIFGLRSVFESRSLLAGSTQLPGKFVWDSVFFVHLTRCGYQYEQFYAFYPMLPGIKTDMFLLLLC